MKHNYSTLDGVRGSAAITVALLHAGVMFPPILVPSAYLAVDLFFLLSGLVLEHAYGKRFDAGMSWRDFMVLRIIRLYPLYWVGALIGIASGGLALLMGAGELNGPGFIAGSAAALLMLPSALTQDQSNLVFVLNPPGWSLFFELAVNAALILFWRRLSTPMLLALVAAGFLGLAISTFQAGNADVGSAWASFPGGFPRVTFSFFLGVLLCRFRRTSHIASDWSWLIVLAPAALFIVAARPEQRPFFDLLCVALLFPALIFAGTQCEPRSRMSRAVFTWLGRISFPLYAVHYPVLELARRSVRVLHIDGGRFAIPIAFCIVTGLAIVSTWLSTYYDEPVRARLTRLVRRREPAGR